MVDAATGTGVSALVVWAEEALLAAELPPALRAAGERVPEGRRDRLPTADSAPVTTDGDPLGAREGEPEACAAAGHAPTAVSAMMTERRRTTPRVTWLSRR
jgi:hypothetical protein